MTYTSPEDPRMPPAVEAPQLVSPAPAPPTTSPWTFRITLLAAVALILAIAFMAPNPFILTLAGYTCAFAVFALSINVVLGGIGEVPLGQCLFFGIGAYGAGIGMNRLGLPFEAAVVLALALSICVAILVGVLTLKLTGAYFSIVSWGLASVAMVSATNLDFITGGALGLYGFPRIAIGPLDLNVPRTYFLVSSTVLTLCVLLLFAVKTSRLGRSMASVRQNRHLAQSLGFDVFRVRLKALVLSAPLAALAGALCLPYMQIVTPEVFSVINTVDGLVMVLLGGSQLLVGPIIGAVMFSILPHYLEMEPNLRILVFSTAIILIMMFAPGGLHQVAVAIWGKVWGRRS